MHNSMVASNYKVSNYIPDDLGFSILSKPPLKSLKRFGSVCKSWSLLFENPNFMNMYRINFLSKNHAFYNDTSLLLQQRIGYFNLYDLYSISGDRFENRVKLDWPKPWPNPWANLFQVENHIGFNILGSYSINGILCLCRNIFQLILWNPATKEFKVIPRSPNESNTGLLYLLSQNSIFGYDHIRDDYKVIRHAQIRRSMAMRDTYDLWEIYSLRRNTWKKLDGNVPLSIYYGEQVFMDGVGHWWSKSKTHNEVFLVSFDFSNETFFTTPIPSDIMDQNLGFRPECRQLMVLNGSIALIVNHTETTTFHISILGEVGVKNSWTKLFVVGLLPSIEYPPIGAWKNGDMFLRKNDGELVSFDINTHMIKDLGIIECRFSKIVIYKESLLPIGGVSD